MRPSYHVKKAGFQLSEMLIVLSVLGVLMALGAIVLLRGPSQEDVAVVTQDSIKQLNSAIAMADTELGLIPRNLGPADVLQDNLQSRAVVVNNPPIPPGCGVSVGAFQAVDATQDVSITLQSGAVIAGVHPVWRPYQGVGDADVVCVAPQGMNSNPDDVRFVTVVRKGNHVPSEFISDTLVAHIPGSADAPESVVLANAESTGTPVSGGPGGAGDVPGDPTVSPDIGITGVGFGGRYSAGATGSNSNSHDFGLWMRDMYAYYTENGTVSTTTLNRFVSNRWDRNFATAYAEGFVANLSDMLQFMDMGNVADITTNNALSNVQVHQHQRIVLWDDNGNELTDMSFKKFKKRLTINGMDWKAFEKQARLDTNNLAGVDPKYRKSDFVLLTVMTRIQDLEIEYTDSTMGTVPVESSVLFFSPIKVTLDGTNAKLNSTHHLAFDVDGFTNTHVAMAHHALPGNGVIQTSGGLNANEAWLVLDKEANGFFREGVLDGNDVFGDHMGHYATGYEELAHLFEQYLKTDDQGQRYLDLTPLSPEQKRTRLLQRLAGDTQLYPAFDLKLLTREGQLIPAHQVLTRIYVDYQSVTECDALQQNCILQRAEVIHDNGNASYSADQWFRAK